MVQDQGLVIVPAGAGAGKTYRIKETLSDWVRKRIVRPDRILAVTYTEAAASELRERIRSALLADGLVQEALAVEQAYVSTIHGLGLRILTEHAFAAGASPQPRHLADAERDLLIRQALANARSLDPIKANPSKFGYKPNWQAGKTVEDALRGRVLSIIDLLRGLGDTGLDPGLIAPSLDRLSEVYGKVLADPDHAATKLETAIRAMLLAFPDGGMATVKAKGPKETLEKNLALFRKVMKNSKCLEQDWALWQGLRSLFTSNNRTKTPEGYDALAQDIMAAADVLPQHPGPLADARLHLQCLIACAQEVMGAYESRKRELGLIDFADMIAQTERLLRTVPSVRQAVLDEVDCVIIDEFQDTNPVQFALLWQLGKQAPRTLLVGDVKQSIMGFQGADPRLSIALANANPDATDPLPNNWRSTPEVMQFVNAMGLGLFGEEYNALEPKRNSYGQTAVEILNITNGRGVRKTSKPQEHVAERITRILTDGEIITDRHTQVQRPARPSDIALLVCAHATAAKYAEELRARGVPVRIAEDGWSGSTVMQVARAALSFAANPADIHSALLFRTLGPNPLTLQEALSQQLDGTLISDPVLEKLAALADHISRLPIAGALNTVLEASGLRIWAEAHPCGPQARADLLRLEAEAEAFETAHRDLKAASGFHGETAKVFLGWLDARRVERDFDKRPDPSANSAAAVEIVTWHASKGREWPITVVAELDYGIEERPGTTSTHFSALDRIDGMEAVLASANLVHTPVFNAPEVQQQFIEDRRTDFEANAKHLLYVALTRARDRVVLEWPGFLKDREDDAPGATCLAHVFEDLCIPVFGDGLLRIAGTDCPARIVEMPELAGFTEVGADNALMQPVFGAETAFPEMSLTPWRLQPSQVKVAESAPQSESVVLGKAWPQSPNDAMRGTALHLAMHTLLKRPDLTDVLPNATGLSPDSITRLSERAQALKAWLSEKGYSELQCEVTVSGQSVAGAEISGTIDLIARGVNGYMIVDHKSGGTGEGFGSYWSQLSAYADLARTHFPDHPLQGVAIFWIDHGRLEFVTRKGMEAV